jgi:ubiquinone/menaquinone biosynthesis C-methylase UbiE
LDKKQVFKEAFRVLKAGGRLSISDVVATAVLPDDIKSDLTMYSGCIVGAEHADIIKCMLIEAVLKIFK